MANSKKGSPVWNFIWDNRSLLTYHLSWNIGNGRKAKFWSDSWGGEKPLKEIFEDQDWVNLVEANTGSKVKDYFSPGGTIGGRVVWKKCSIGNRDLCAKLDQLLSQRQIFVFEKEDKVFWCATKSGEYKVKWGYEIQRKRIRNPEWPYKLCWHNRILPKAGAFFLIALQDKVLTVNILKYIGIVGPSRCILCKKDEETSNHFLFNCSFASSCWEWFFDMIEYNSARNEKLLDFMSAWPLYFKSKWGDLWLVGPSMIVWHIWKERNRRIFREEYHSREETIKSIKTTIEEVVSGNIRKKRIIFYNACDKKMEKRWAFKELTKVRIADKAKDRKKVRWIAPKKDWTKLNFDGASRGNPGKVGYGEVIRDKNGSFLQAIYEKIEDTTNNEAEIRALEAGLEMCVEKGLTKVTIEGDSQIIINGVTKRKFQSWKLNKWLPRISVLMDKIGDFEFRHSYREGNKVADILANMGVTIDKGKIFMDSLSGDIEDMVQKEIMDEFREGIG